MTEPLPVASGDGDKQSPADTVTAASADSAQPDSPSDDDKGKAVAQDAVPEPAEPIKPPSQSTGRDDDDADDDDEEEDDEDEDEEDDEPRLKYARLTPHLGPVYRNGDATSAFLVAGDKMVRPCHLGVREKLV